MHESHSHLIKSEVALTVCEAKKLGFTRRQLENGRFSKPFHGIRVINAQANEQYSGDKVRTLARYYAPRLSSQQVFSHETALLLHGCPIKSAEVLHVMGMSGTYPPRTRGVVGHQSKLSLEEVLCWRNALPVSKPLPALAQAAGRLEVIELVIAMDHLLCSAIDAEQLYQALDHFVISNSLRGAKKLRQAFSMCRIGAESRKETELRLLLNQNGFDALELQVDIVDENGFIGRFDMINRQLKLIFEYDGEQHRLDRSQYLKDVVRLDRVRRQGWRVARFHNEDLSKAEVSRVVARVFSAAR